MGPCDETDHRRRVSSVKALKVIRRHNFSAAIFAPGWVYETLEDKAEFCRHQDR